VEEKLSPLEKLVLREWLKGIKTPKDIAERINAKPSSVRVALYRLRRKGIIKEIDAFEKLVYYLKQIILLSKLGDINNLREIAKLSELALKQTIALRRYFQILNPKLVKNHEIRKSSRG